jgi:DNA-binding NarL/FixJ family response regulator
LAEEGLSDREIADRLLLSRRTVTTHVSHLLKKFGGHSRTDIARLKGVSDRFEALASAAEQ